MSAEKGGGAKYPKGDARRLFSLLLAIEELERPTLVSIVARTGHNRGTLQADVDRLNTQFDVSIVKDGPVYKIESWGRVLNKAGLRSYLQS